MNIKQLLAQYLELLKQDKQEAAEFLEGFSPETQSRLLYELWRQGSQTPSIVLKALH